MIIINRIISVIQMVSGLLFIFFSSGPVYTILASLLFIMGTLNLVGTFIGGE